MGTDGRAVAGQTRPGTPSPAWHRTRPTPSGWPRSTPRATPRQHVDRCHHRSRAPFHAAPRVALRDRRHRHQVAGTHPGQLGDRGRLALQDRGWARGRRRLGLDDAFQSAGHHASTGSWATTRRAAARVQVTDCAGTPSGWAQTPAFAPIAGRGVRDRVCTGLGDRPRRRLSRRQRAVQRPQRGVCDREAQECPRGRVWSARAARARGSARVYLDGALSATISERCCGRRRTGALHAPLDGVWSTHAQGGRGRHQARRRRWIHHAVIAAGYCG